jgi:hypothetical protein
MNQGGVGLIRVLPLTTQTNGLNCSLLSEAALLFPLAPHKPPSEVIHIILAE